MAFVIADNAKETTTTSGTGNYTSSGTAAAGYLTIAAAIGESNQSCFCVRSGSDAEIFLGTVGAGNAITRDLILSSTNGGDPVNWPDSEAKDIFCTMSAKLMVFLAAALQGGDAGKGVVVNAGGTGFELGGPFLPKAGGSATGTIVVSPSAAEARVAASAMTGYNAVFAAMKEGVLRWKIGAFAPGHDFAIMRYDESGNYIDLPLSIPTETGLVQVKGNPTSPMGIATKQFVDGKTAAATTASLGTVIKANLAAMIAGTADSYPDAAVLAAMSYESATGTSLSSVKAGTIGYLRKLHGLGVMPKSVGCFFRCTDDDAGYSAGITLNASSVMGGGGVGEPSCIVWGDETTVGAEFNDTFVVLSKGGQSSGVTALDSTKWDVILRASLF